jgi:hypothetical protein
MSPISSTPSAPAVRFLTGAHPDRTVRHFNQVDLSRRWNISPRTLERWRWLKQGPGYLKIGGRVVYRLEDIEAFEAAQIKKAGQQPAKAACE